MVTTLTGLDKGDENDIDVYTDSPLQPSHSAPDSNHEDHHCSEEKRRRNIVLRNMMLDMILSLLSSSHMELNTRCIFNYNCSCT